MTNKLYVVPACGECIDVKKLLDEKGIEYIEVNAGVREGKKEFQDFYRQNKDCIERNGMGQIILPVFRFDSTIIQGLEQITASLN